MADGSDGSRFPDRPLCFWRGFNAGTQLSRAKDELELAKTDQKRGATHDQLNMTRAAIRLNVEHAIEGVTSGGKSLFEGSCIGMSPREFDDLKGKMFMAMEKGDYGNASYLLTGIDNLIFNGAKKAGAPT